MQLRGRYRLWWGGKGGVGSEWERREEGEGGWGGESDRGRFPNGERWAWSQERELDARWKRLMRREEGRGGTWRAE